MTIMTIPDVDAAERQWQQVRDRLPTPVILAANNVKLHGTPVLHILALSDVIVPNRPRGRPRKPGAGGDPGSLQLVGLDTPHPTSLAHEACFCIVPTREDVLQFRVVLERSRQDRYRLPSCQQCLRVCGRITGLPVDLIKGRR